MISGENLDLGGHIHLVSGDPEIVRFRAVSIGPSRLLSYCRICGDWHLFSYDCSGRPILVASKETMGND